MEKAWRLIIDGAREPQINMAVDEAIMLCSAEADCRPTLRIYRWAYPCVSIGKFQQIDDLPRLGYGLPIVHRPTGGGAVYHNGEGFTYSLIYRERDDILPKGASNSYKEIHSGILNGLRELGIKSELFSSGDPERKRRFGDICFTFPVEFDVICENKKIAGAAQRRRFGVVLHQGEISLGIDVWRKWSYNDIQNTFINGLSKQLKARFLEIPLSDKENLLAEELIREHVEEVTR